MRRNEEVQGSIGKKTAFLRILVPLVAGIVLENEFRFSPRVELFAWLASTLFLIICVSLRTSPGAVYRRGWITGAAIQVTMLCTGLMLLRVHQFRPVAEELHFKKNDPGNYILLEIQTDASEKKESYKYTASIHLFIKNHKCYNAREKVLVYIRKNSNIPEISRGSFILIHRLPDPVKNSNVPGFDYRKFCISKHIYGQVFLEETDFLIIRKGQENPLSMSLNSLREKLNSAVKKYIGGKPEYGLLEALLVGYTEDLDRSILSSYSDSGVIHIIAISGLHLALICHFLQWVLMKTSPAKSGRWIKLSILIGCLWAYSLLSGASPSVIRAAMMFSLALVAGHIRRENNLFHLLAASAFILVCFDPYWLWDKGFQLSYAAVMGLGLFSNPVKNLVPIQNKILSATWNAASVSIAAQILTTPVSIYYFHRFPSYFLVANLVAVPLSSLVLACGIFLCLTSPLSFIATPTGWIEGSLIHLLNGFIGYISHLPGAVIANLECSLTRLIVLYIIIFFFYQFLLCKNKHWFFGGLISICVFMILNLWH